MTKINEKTLNILMFREYNFKFFTMYISPCYWKGNNINISVFYDIIYLYYSFIVPTILIMW